MNGNDTTRSIVKQISPDTTASPNSLMGRARSMNAFDDRRTTIIDTADMV